MLLDETIARYNLAITELQVQIDAPPPRTSSQQRYAKRITKYVNSLKAMQHTLLAERNGFIKGVISCAKLTNADKEVIGDYEAIDESNLGTRIDPGNIDLTI